MTTLSVVSKRLKKDKSGFEKKSSIVPSMYLKWNLQKIITDLNQLKMLHNQN